MAQLQRVLFWRALQGDMAAGAYAAAAAAAAAAACDMTAARSIQAAAPWHAQHTY
jgi:hypothetical protein